MLLQAATQAAATAASQENRLVAIIAESDLIIKITLLILVSFSVISWAIIAIKWGQIRTAKRRTIEFLRQFSATTSLEAFLQRGKFPAGPTRRILRASLAPLKEEGAAEPLLRVKREATRSTTQEIEDLEHYVPFLATTASATPFIGLFGTVWGILNAFFEISQAGSSSIAVVGPRIAEALFATAVGLAAAIPAVVFYNLFVNRIRILARQLEQFADDLVHRVEHELIHDQRAA